MTATNPNQLRVTMVAAALLGFLTPTLAAAQPTQQETEAYLQYSADTAMTQKSHSRRSGWRDRIYRFDFDGPTFTFEQTYVQENRGDFYTVDIRDAAAIKIRPSTGELVAEDRADYGCPTTRVLLSCPAGTTCFPSRVFREDGSGYDAVNRAVWFRFCQNRETDIRRFVNALKHLASLHGIDLKIDDPEATGSAFD